MEGIVIKVRLSKAGLEELNKFGKCSAYTSERICIDIEISK